MPKHLAMVKTTEVDLGAGLPDVYMERVIYIYICNITLYMHMYRWEANWKLGVMLKSSSLYCVKYKWPVCSESI